MTTVMKLLILKVKYTAIVFIVWCTLHGDSTYML